MIDWPSVLVQDLGRRRAVLFLGSGISRNATNADGRRPKTWVEFLQESAKEITPNKHIWSLMKQRDYLTACEVLKNAVGRDKFRELLRAEFLVPKFSAAPIHEAIFKLDSRIVITPNFDKIYETYANYEASSSIVVKHHYDEDIAEAIRDTDRLILKIHGSIDSPEKMIFTRKEYAHARQVYREFYSVLEALALTHTFLFLGCGVNDPDIRLLLEDTFFRHPSSRAHVFILPTGLHLSIRNVLEESMNLNILTYSPGKDHEQLTKSVVRLVELVEEYREELRETGNW
jgi:hypothetical protein